MRGVGGWSGRGEMAAGAAGAAEDGGTRRRGAEEARSGEGRPDPGVGRRREGGVGVRSRRRQMASGA